MNYCKEIKAYFRREERYEGLQLVYGAKNELKDVILDIIEDVKKETDLSPMIFENISKDDLSKQAIYLEFSDSYDREGDEFFEKVLRKLGIDKCT